MILDKIFFLEVKKKKLCEEIDRLSRVESMNRKPIIENDEEIIWGPIENEEIKEKLEEIQKIETEIEGIIKEIRDKESKEYIEKITNEKGQIIDPSRFTGVEPIIKTHIPIHEVPQEKRKPGLACKAVRNSHR